jgi:hypothetical protein
MSARPGPGGGYQANWYPYRDPTIRVVTGIAGEAGAGLLETIQARLKA